MWGNFLRECLTYCAAMAVIIVGLWLMRLGFV